MTWLVFLLMRLALLLKQWSFLVVDIESLLEGWLRLGSQKVGWLEGGLVKCLIIEKVRGLGAHFPVLFVDFFMTLKQHEGLIHSYENRDFSRGPETYRDADLIEKIINAGGFREFSVNARVLDCMSGPGVTGLAVREKLPQLSYTFVDFVQAQLEKIPREEGISVVLADVCDPLEPLVGKVDAAVVRYGIKDVPAEHQCTSIGNIASCLSEGGKLVVVDMLAPSIEVKNWLNDQHSLKQELGGRKLEVEGVCHIPTKREWLEMLGESGFKAKVYGYHESAVTTQDWVRGGQVRQDQVAYLNHMILSAPSSVVEAFSISSSTHPQLVGRGGLSIEEAFSLDGQLDVGLIYPVVIISAEK
jgi:hypothetical protein